MISRELNAECSNLSIERDQAAMHLYADNIELARLGGPIAIGTLQEQSSRFARSTITITMFDGGRYNGHPLVTTADTVI